MNSKDFNNDAEREGAADSTSAQGSAQTSSGFQGSAQSGQNAYGQNGQSAYGQAGTAQGRPGQAFQGAPGRQSTPGYQNGPAFQGAPGHQAPGYHSNPGTYGQSGMDRFFNSIRAMNLYRAQPRVLGGVCSGISQRYGIDMTLVRILFIVAALLGFGGFLYSLAWAFLPEVEDGRIHVEQALHGDFTGGLAGAIVLALFSGAPASVSLGFLPILPSFFGNSTLIGIAAVVAVLLIANSRRNSQNYSGYPYGPGGYDGGAGYGPDGGNGGGTDGGYGNNGVGSENYDPNGAYASTRGYDGGVGHGPNGTYNGRYGPNGTYNGGEGQQVFSAPPVGSNGKPIPRWQGNYNAGGPRPNYQPYQRKNWVPGPGSMLSLITLGLLVMCAIPMVLEQSLRSLVISAALAAGVMGLALAVCAVRGRHGGWISVMAVFSLIFGFMPIAAITSAAPQSALDIDWQNVRVDKSNYNYMVSSIPNFVGETTLDLTQAPAGENRTITVNSFVGQLTIKTAYGQSVRIEMDHSKGVEAVTLSAYSPWQVSENGVVQTLQPTNTYNSIDGDDDDSGDSGDDASTPTPRNWVTASPSPSGTAATSPSTAVATPGTAVASPSSSAVASPGATASSNGDNGSGAGSSANNGTNSGSSRPFAMYYYEKSTVNGWPSGSGSKLIFSSPASVQSANAKGANAHSSKGTITVKVGQAVGQVRTIESAPTSN